jgi:type I restriction enzyme S subunit
VAELLRDGALEIGDGYRAKNSELGVTGIPFARVQNIRNGFELSNADLFPVEDLGKVGSKVSRPGDCVITTKGSVGRVAYVNESTPAFVYSPQLSYWRSLRPDQIESTYLRYWLQGPEFLEQCAQVKGSTDMADYVNLRDQRSMSITLPPPGDQRKVASILSAYDELIENNTRRIEILEEMAQAIYREWFMSFRYPHHGGVPLVGSERGPAPEGWAVTSVGDVAEIVRGRSYTRDELTDVGGLPFLNLKCIERDGGFRRSGIKRYTGKFKENQRTFPGDIVVAVTDMTQERRVVARAARIPSFGEPFGIISLDLAKLIPADDLGQEFLLGMLRYSGFADEVKNHANGVNVLHLDPKRILDFRFVLPPAALRHEYCEAVAPMFALVDVLSESSERLRAARDLLLPRLISGKVDVSDLDLDVGELVP